MKRVATIGLLILLLSPFYAYGGSIDIKRAVDIATERVPGEVLKVELERGIYEVKIKTREGRVVEVYVDARDGSILERKNISIDDAVNIATKEVPGAVVKVEFERGIYEVKIRTPDGSVAEVYVDGRDGTIVKLKRGYYGDEYKGYEDDD